MVDLVAGPTTGGVILAFETGRQLGVRSLFAEEVHDDDGTTRREFRRGFRIEPGERVLLVDDILTTGGSLLAMIPAVEAMGGEIVECAVLVDRGGGRTTLTSPTTGRVYPLRALWQLDLPTYEPGPRHVPAVRGRHAPPHARQQRDRRLIRGSADPERLRGRPRDRHRPDRRRGAHRSGATSGPIADPPADADVGTASSSRWTRGRSPMSAASTSGRPMGAVRDLRSQRPARTAPSSRPGHLGEHMATASPVRVWYRRDGRRRSRRLDRQDAPWPRQP